eukprot:c14657_g2_i1 orf=196-615(+)
MFSLQEKGHVKDCYKLKKEMRKNQGEKRDKKVKSEKDSTENVNSISRDDDILFASDILLTEEMGDYSTWIIDSGTSFHVTPHRHWFSSFSSGHYGIVHLGDNYTYPISRIGDVKLALPDGTTFLLTGVRYVPNLKKNLI